ncbi:MAG: hypothetical protein NT027_17435 [Proteobacteria bacterium]|nr:hypothetical protein [Pseudomonadota bacterium]
MLLTDGADSRPGLPWNEKLQGRGGLIRNRHQGHIIGFGKPATPGYWLDDTTFPPFAFEGKSTQVDVVVVRAEKSKVESIQVQLSIDGNPTASANAVFAESALEARTTINFATPARGSHLISIKALPVAGENDTWDNQINHSLDVLPNTLGILHLLGSPTWDGRFLRRYLKSEPKFDLISFFILRDPWDSQQVNERELSLIPFPVERLFKEELPSFRVLVIQNFTMQQFLQPEFQSNLAKFVTNGGGLLFIGGPRALTEGDIIGSGMADILPFTIKSNRANNLSIGLPQIDGKVVGSTFNADIEYKVELAEPSSEKRALANVYDDFERLGNRLSSLKTMKGLHNTLDFKFNENEVTTLLNARTKDGKVSPLAVASYPGKGRAIWIFSDSLWRVGMESGQDRSRFDYQSIVDSSMTWLMRNDRRPSLIAQDLRIEDLADGEKIAWRLRLTGPSARYVGAKGSEWTISLCGKQISLDQVSATQQGSEEWILSGEQSQKARSGFICTVTVKGEHPAFGQVNASAMTMLSEKLTDSEMSPSPRKLNQLARLTDAKLTQIETAGNQEIGEWLQQWTADQGVSLPNRFRTLRDFYWMQNRNWIWLVLFLLPLEVIIRRWHLIGGRPT